MGESTPNIAYLTYHQQATNSLHPSCNPTTSPMEVEPVNTLEGEEISLMRRGEQDRDRETRRDRERRGERGQHREERRDRHRHGRDQERRGDDRRQRDRGDRTYRTRHGTQKPNPRRS